MLAYDEEEEEENFPQGKISVTYGKTNVNM